MNKRYSTSESCFMKTLEPTLINTDDLMEFVNLGKNKAIEFGIEAGARVKIGRRTLWSVSKLNEYIESIAG